MILMKVEPGECPIFCSGDLVTLRDVDVEAFGKVVQCDTLEYQVEFPTGCVRVSGETLELADPKLAAHRAKVFRGYMEPVRGFWVKKSPYIFTSAMRTDN